MKPLMLLSALVVWFTACRLIPDHNTGTAVFLLVPAIVILLAARVELRSQSDGGVEPNG